ncbi:MAG TPA: hypothetical protein VGF53_04535 [Pseudolabrys sp.]|jgi:hypothetical protein
MEAALNATAETVLTHVSERSVLNEIAARGLVPFALAGRKRFATCSGVAWFHGCHVAVVNLYGGHLRVYRFDCGADGVQPRLELLHEMSAGLSFPENVAASPDGSVLAITHSMSDAHGISLHSIEPGSLAPQPTTAMLRIGRAFHGLNFTPDSRHLAFTEIGTPGYIEVARIDSGACTCRLDNTYDLFKPKSAAFLHDGSFVAVAFSPGLRSDGVTTIAGGLLTVHRFDAERGIIEPEAVAELGGADGSLGALESCTILPAPPGGPFRILAADQAADIVLAIDFDPQQARLSFAGVFAAGMSFPHGVDVSADGRFVAVANYGDDTLRIVRVKSDGS